MNFGNGNIGYEVPSGPGAAGAQNGLSTNAGFVVLGQDVGQAGNPAALINIREIPFTDSLYVSFQSTLVPLARITIGVVPGISNFNGIEIDGNEPSKTPVLVLNDKGATSPINGFWSIQSLNNSFNISDSLGIITQWTRTASLLQTAHRNLMSHLLRGNLWANRPVFDSTVGFTISTVTQGTQPRTTITNRGAAASITISLPGFTVIGVEYSFLVIAGFSIVIQAQAGVTLRNGALLTAAGGTLTGAAQGSTIRLLCISATEWAAVATIGAWI